MGFPPFPPPAAAARGGWQEEGEELEEEDQGWELLVELEEEEEEEDMPPPFPPPLMLKLDPQLLFGLSPVLEWEVISLLFLVVGGKAGEEYGSVSKDKEAQNRKDKLKRSGSFIYKPLPPAASSRALVLAITYHKAILVPPLPPIPSPPFLPPFTYQYISFKSKI